MQTEGDNPQSPPRAIFQIGYLGMIAYRRRVFDVLGRGEAHGAAAVQPSNEGARRTGARRQPASTQCRRIARIRIAKRADAHSPHVCPFPWAHVRGHMPNALLERYAASTFLQQPLRSMPTQGGALKEHATDLFQGFLFERAPPPPSPQPRPPPPPGRPPGPAPRRRRAPPRRRPYGRCSPHAASRYSC